MIIDINKMGAMCVVPAPGPGKAIKVLNFSAATTLVEYEIVDVEEERKDDTN